MIIVFFYFNLINRSKLAENRGFSLLGFTLLCAINLKFYYTRFT